MTGCCVEMGALGSEEEREEGGREGGREGLLRVLVEWNEVYLVLFGRMPDASGERVGRDDFRVCLWP